MRFALIGQPNSGKSTLFNHVAGFKAETGNFSGTTVSFTESKIRVSGQVVDIVDLPGTYTLSGTNPAERETLDYLVSHDVDLLINVVDASHISQGLSLTLELLELQRPIVVALNMMDEAARLGMTIDGPKLQDILAVAVVPLVASKGRGVRNLFVTALKESMLNRVPSRPDYGRDLEVAIHSLVDCLDGQGEPIKAEPLAIKLLEGDQVLLSKVREVSPQVIPVVKQARDRISQSRGQDPIWVISAERHGLAANIAANVVTQGQRRVSKRDRLDNILLHPFFGYVTLVLILLIFFELIYAIGNTLETPLLELFLAAETRLLALVPVETLLAQILVGVIQGIAGGVAIVLPYLIPFLLGLGFLEDVGYLPRVAFLMDALMNRMGLHGKAVVPFILGYGCNVPAVMSTRMLEERRDRFLAATLATLVPCAARLAVVFGLVAFYLGPRLALAIYLFNLFVIAITGRLISSMLPEETPGLILEMPVYRIPTLRTVVHKAWFRAREFIVEAWPILIIGSIILAVFTFYHFAGYINLLIRPLTWILGLPAEVGMPLIFGILRKELSMIMLHQALGTSDLSLVLSSVQMITFTVFVVFYVPCLATLAVLKGELGTRNMFWISAMTVLIAVLAALVARGAAFVLAN
jgi:ferrous iron transport protein B